MLDVAAEAGCDTQEIDLANCEGVKYEFREGKPGVAGDSHSEDFSRVLS